jgi:hypothetical protein
MNAVEEKEELNSRSVGKEGNVDNAVRGYGGGISMV